jgi:hypothetical protein
VPADDVPARETGEFRASDADRDRAVGRLQDGLAAGMLDMDEFHERSELALRARTRAELAPLTADLPTGDGPAWVAGPPPDDLVVLRGSASAVKRNGQWRVPRTLVLEQRHGSAELDFTQALIQHTVIEIALDINGGSVEMRLPDGASASLDDVEAIRSSLEDRRRNAPAHGQPHFTITGTIRRSSVQIRGPRKRLFRRGQ